MDLAKLFQEQGLGVMATADLSGNVNTAIYARPYIIDATTLVWGMTDGRTLHNVAVNPHASFLFKSTGPGFGGVRLRLELMRTEKEGTMLTQIQQNTNQVVGPGAGRAVTHAAWFRLEETRPLV